MEDEQIKLLFGELGSIKGLLILQALALGCQQKHIAAALGASEATLSRMFPKGFAKGNCQNRRSPRNQRDGT
jgi:hypothetical protein